LEKGERKASEEKKILPSDSRNFQKRNASAEKTDLKGEREKGPPEDRRVAKPQGRGTR